MASILAMDLGSSSVRTALFDRSGLRLPRSTAQREYSIRYTRDGGAELDAALVLRRARECLRATLRTRKKPLLAISGSAFWHGLLGVDRNAEPLTPIYTWADARSSSDATGLRGEISERRIQLRTGCMLRAPYWPAKLRWLRRTQRSLFRRTARWVSPGAWLFEKLFGEAMTSHSMASGTGLYNLADEVWDRDLYELCHLRPEQLGNLGDRGLTSDGIALFSAIGDGAAGNLGSGADRPDQIAINVGTSAAVRVVLPKQSKNEIPAGLFRYVVDANRVVVGGAISNGGNLHQWCLRELRLTPAAAERALARDLAATDTLTVLPFWIQERAPTWPEHLRGVIAGLTPASTSADILRAATTSTYYRLAEILDQLPGKNSSEIIVSGGILHSPNSLAILADALGRNLRICRELESSLRGAAVYALENLGYRAARLNPGKVVRHRPALSRAHRSRRNEQRALEERLLKGAAKNQGDAGRSFSATR